MLAVPRLKLICLLILFFSTVTFSQKSVLTQHNDLFRTGWYDDETILNKSNVQPGIFGKIFARPVDDQIYAQPLVKLNLNIPGKGVKNVVFVATVNNSVYAFDADSANVTTPYWQMSLTEANSRAVKNTDMTGACGGVYRDFSGNMGIVGTPVIDTTTNTLYVVARSINTSSNVFVQYLHALDITTGAEKPNSPVLIAASVPGNGDGSVSGDVHFDPQKNNQRPGLLLFNGIVYIAWSSHCDWGPYHGWVMGYNKTTLQQQYVYCSTPDGYNGGIWMSGGGPSADSSGNVYVAVGNGSVGVNNDVTNLRNRSESALKLSPSLTVNSYFTPQNYPDLEAADLDFGVTEMMLIPNTNLVMTSCKDGNIYLLNRDNMGGYNASNNNVVQNINLGVDAHLRSSFAYYKGEQKEFAYSWSENALLRAFPFDRTSNIFDLNNTIASGVQGPIGNNGAFLAISSNGSVDSTAILWTSYAANGDANQSVRPGILRAFDATDVTKELWNSSVYTSDNPGKYAKFNCPTVANGKVYLATFSNQLVVYGLTGKTNNNCSDTNRALNKPTYASSIYDNTLPASNATDGNLNSRWSSEFSDPQSIYVDLGARYDICNVVLYWETAVAQDFKIQVSEDAQTWTDVVAITGNASLENHIPMNTSGRYVRMYGTQRGTVYGYSLWEFEVYGKPSASNCGTPTGLSVSDIYENSATLHWNTNGASRFNVQYKTVSAGSWTLATSDTSAITLTGLSCSTDYLFMVQGVCGNDSGAYSSSAPFSTLTCNSNCSPLPTRWSTQDIGDIGVAGSACYSNGVFELNGSGTDIWDTQDAFRFAYKTVVGDGEIKARVVTMDQSDQWNKCGIMFRESLTPGSRHAFMAMTSGNGAAFQNRTITDGYSNNVNTGAGTTVPYWIKLVKKGSVYTGYISRDGNTWAQVGDPIDAGFGVNIPVYAGLALTSHNNDILSTATVDNYLFSGILELELQSFTANVTLDKTVTLQWVTTLENNIESFVVERSKDNIHYTDLDTIDAVNNGTYTQTYNDEDKNPLAGFSYYRLRITNIYGVVSYSAPVFVRISDSKAPLMYPNPAKSYVHVVQGEEMIKTINVYNITGRTVVKVNNSAANVIDIPIYALADGIYIVEIRTANSVYREKLVVHN